LSKKDIALAWARAGFTVLPIGRDKRPLVAWRAMQETPWTDSEIANYWNNNPDANIGVIPGSNDWAVVDGDIYKHSAAAEQFSDWLLDNNLTLQDGPEAHTGSGGLHLWLKAPGGVKSGPINECIDIKSNGGYVLVPGSESDSGIYKWSDRATGITADGIPAVASELPAGVVQSNMAGEAVSQNRGTFQDGTVVSIGKAKDGRERLLADAVWFAGNRIVEERGDLQDLDAWAERAEERFAQVARGRHGKELQDDWPRSEVLAKCRSTLPKLLSIVGSVEDDKVPVAEPRRFKVDPWNTQDFNPIGDDDLVEGLLSQSSLSVLYGPSNSGKTFQAMALAFAVSTGTEFYGRQAMQGRVVYLAAEGAANIRKRRAALKIEHKDMLEKRGELPAFDMIGSSFNLLSPVGDIDALIEAIGEADLIVIDTLAAVAAGGDENTAPTMLAIVNNCRKLISRTGAHVMLVHHMGKSEEKGARGHSSLRAALDTELEVMAVPGTNIGRIKITKQRDMELAAQMGFELRTVVIHETANGDQITSCVVDPKDVKRNTTKKSSLVRGLEKIIFNKFNSATRPAARPSRIEVNGTMINVIDAIDSEIIRDSFKSLPENDGVTSANLRKRYQRALLDVCREGDIVYGSEKIGLLRDSSERIA
jgi:archaellum biogenesis ATPase FlaH